MVDQALYSLSCPVKLNVQPMCECFILFFLFRELTINYKPYLLKRWTAHITGKNVFITELSQNVLGLWEKNLFAVFCFLNILIDFYTRGKLFCLLACAYQLS